MRSTFESRTKSPNPKVTIMLFQTNCGTGPQNCLFLLASASRTSSLRILHNFQPSLVRARLAGDLAPLAPSAPPGADAPSLVAAPPWPPQTPCAPPPSSCAPQSAPPRDPRCARRDGARPRARILHGANRGVNRNGHGDGGRSGGHGDGPRPACGCPQQRLRRDAL